MEIAERIRREVADRTFDVETSSEPIRATISVGVAAYPRDGQDANELIHQADLAVYRAKLQGRNRALDASSEPLAVPSDRKPRLVAVPESDDHLEPLPPAVELIPPEDRRHPRTHAVHGPRFLSLSFRPRAPRRLRLGRRHRRGRAGPPARLQPRRLRAHRSRRARRLRPGARDRGGRRRLDLGQRGRLPRRRCPVRPAGGARPRGHDRGRRVERPQVGDPPRALQHRRAHALLARSGLRVRRRLPEHRGRVRHGCGRPRRRARVLRASTPVSSASRSRWRATSPCGGSGTSGSHGSRRTGSSTASSAA